MQLVNEFVVDAPIDIAWAVLTDIPQVAACIPGAELESSDGDEHRAVARLIDGEERERLWPLMRSGIASLPKAEQRTGRSIPLIAIDYVD